MTAPQPIAPVNAKHARRPRPRGRARLKSVISTASSSCRDPTAFPTALDDVHALETPPKTTWRPSSQAVFTVQMKNCEPFVPPAFAMERRRRPCA